MSLFNKAAQELLALRAASVSNAETIRQLRAEIESLKEQVAQLQTIISEEATDSGNVILELATANETIAALKEQIAQLEREFKIEFGDLHDSYMEQQETIAQQAEALRVKDEAFCPLLKELMDMAVANGANSISMPDEYVAAAVALSIQPSPDILRERYIHVIANFLERVGKWMTNDAMLQERDARLVERIAENMDGIAQLDLREIADKIRKGEFN